MTPDVTRRAPGEQGRRPITEAEFAYLVRESMPLEDMPDDAFDALPTEWQLASVAASLRAVPPGLRGRFARAALAPLRCTAPATYAQTVPILRGLLRLLRRMEEVGRG